MSASPGALTARHERKFVLSREGARWVLAALPAWPGAPREAYPPRKVNSLYFDTASFAFLRASLDGLDVRAKARVRWYGETFGRPASAVLELKRKDGLAGTKEALELPGFELPDSSCRRDILDSAALRASGDAAAALLKGLEPVLLVGYLRRYFASRGGRLRITLDEDIRAWRPSFAAGMLPLDDPGSPCAVLELKYPPEAEAEAAALAGKIPARLARHSKYLRAAGLIRPFF